MVRWAWAVLGCLCAAEVDATHLVGGEMSYSYVGTDAAGNRLYEVHCFIYRDCGPTNTNGTGFDLNAAFAVYLDGALVTTVNSPLDASTVVQVVPETPSTCAVLPPDLCVERAEYVFTVALPVAPGNYTIVHSRCCRSPAVTNLDIPEDQGFTLSVVLPGAATVAGPNSSPSFLALPQAFLCAGIPFGLDNAAFDADGDSLAYALGPIYLGGDPTAPMPAVPLGPPFTEVGWAAGYAAAAPLGAGAGTLINPLTGLFTGIPQSTGKFALGIWVEEWREGILLGAVYRDFTVDVVVCAAEVPEVIAPEPCSGLTAAFTVVTPGATGFAWEFGDGFTSEVPSPTHTYAEPGVYTVSTTYTLGECTGTLWFNVVAVPPWSVELEPGEQVCTGSGWEWGWTAVGEVPPGAEWNWSAGGDWTLAGETVAGGSGASGSVQVATSWLGCTFGDTVVATLPPLPEVELDVLTEPCSGWEVTWWATGSDPEGVEWEVAGPATTGPPVLTSSGGGVAATVTVPAPGVYTATATVGAATGCPATATLAWEVVVPGPLGTPVAEVLYGCTDTARVALTWAGGQPSDVVWTLPDGSTLLGSYVEWETTEGVWSIEVAATDSACGEVATAAVEATVIPSLLASTYFLPNVFTPNSDGKNEGYRPEGPAGFPPGAFSTYVLEIYNRWGNLVFASEVPGAAWTGEGHAEGTYFAHLVLGSACGGEVEDTVQSFSLLR